MLGLRALRIRARKSQADLAKELGVSQAAIAAWECCIKYPTADKLPAIAKALNCSIDELYSVQTA